MINEGSDNKSNYTSRWLRSKKKQLIGLFNDIDTKESGEILFDRWLKILIDICDTLHTNKFDLAIFSANKAWGFFNSMLPFLIKYYGKSYFEKEIEPKIIQDKMLYFWLCKEEHYDPDNIKVAVVDDSCVLGNAIGNIVRDLIKNYNMQENNIRVFAFEVEYIEKDAYTQNRFEEVNGDWYILLDQDAERQESDALKYKIKWLFNSNPIKEKRDTKYMRRFSKMLIESTAINSVPYLSYSHGFIIDRKDIEKTLGMGIADEDTGFIKQDQLTDEYADSNKYDFYNITSASFYENNVQSFVLFPKDCTYDFLPHKPDQTGEDIIAKTLRIYINRNKHTGYAMIQSYIHIRSLAELSDANIVEVMGISKVFKDLLEPKSDCLKDILNPNNEMKSVAAWRLLGHATNYIYGKLFTDKIINGKRNIEISDRSTLKSSKSSDLENYYKYLDTSTAKADLKAIFDKLVASSNDEELLFDGDIENDVSPENELFDLFFQRLTKNESKKFNLNTQMSLYFSELARTTVPGRVPSVLLLKFINRLKKNQNHLSRNHIIAAIFGLVDSGQAKLDFKYSHSKKRFERDAPTGEQACHGLYYKYPSYACALQLIKNKYEESKIDQSILADFMEKYKNKTRNHFKDVRNEDAITIESLMHIWLNFTNHANSPREVYCAELFQKRYDKSQYFFNKLVQQFEEHITSSTDHDISQYTVLSKDT